MSKKLDAKDKVLAVALKLAGQFGYHRVTRQILADSSGVSPAMVSLYFGTMLNLRRAIMSEAIFKRDLRVIAQGLALGDSKANAAKLELREAAARSLI